MRTRPAAAALVVALVAALLSCVLVGTGAGAAPAEPGPAAAPSSTGLQTTGYVLGSARDRLVRRDAHGLATLAVVGVSLARDGRSVDVPDADERRLLGTAHAQGLRAEVLLSNYSNRLQDFDPRAAARLLRHPDRVSAVAGQLAAAVTAQGWDGVQVDLESMDAADADGLVALVQQLQQAMPPEKSVSVAVSASADPDAYLERGYRLAELGQAVDTLALMTYDQHGPWSRPGPVGALPWQRAAMAVVTAAVPAAKVDLGVAGYGYQWPPRGSRRTGSTVTVAQAERLVARDGATARWRRGPGEWTARLSDGTRLWWSDGRSHAARQALATELGAHGLALWRLGSADPL